MQSTLLVCDDVRFEFNGKAILVGVYTADIVIPISPFTAGQIYFFFSFECGVDEIPKSLAFEVTLPGQKPLRWPVHISPDIKIPEDRRTAYVRQPCPVFSPQLIAGRIEAKVIHDRGEISVGAPWIVHMPPTSIPLETQATPGEP